MPFHEIVARYRHASAEFDRRLSQVRPEQWCWPTPCSEWNVRQLVNHMAQGNLNYVRLAEGVSAAEFLRHRDEDALGDDPVAAYREGVRRCAETFDGPGVLSRTFDYPLGRLTGAQALAVRTTDSVVHTWDLARAVGGDEVLAPDLVTWVDQNMDAIYAGLAETPVSAETTNRFFAAARVVLVHPTPQERVLHRMGR
ncbi:TIGR03086 family metal-binding protein [Kibdelosporangium lantanae]